MQLRVALMISLAALLGPLAVPTSAQDLPLPRGADRASAKISEAAIRAVTAELASDAYEGRGPGSAGDVKARAWLETRMKALGLAPGAADGTYQQRFEMVGTRTTLPSEWLFRAANGDATATLRPREDFVAMGEKQREHVAVESSEVVFVGFGIVAPEFGWNDYKSDVRGKTVLILNNDPDWDPALFAGERRLYYGRWDYKYAEAARHGAAVAIVVHTTKSAGYPWQVVRTSWSGERYDLAAGDEPRLEVRAWATEAKAREVAALGGRDFAQLVESAKSREFTPVALGVTTSLSLPTALRRSRPPTCSRCCPAATRSCATMVVITAHHDHLGRRARCPATPSTTARSTTRAAWGS